VALRIWKETIHVCAQNPWVYRADWAYTNIMQPPRARFTTADTPVSLLNRIGYAGPQNLDLKGAQPR